MHAYLLTVIQFIHRSNQELTEYCSTNGLQIDPLTINMDRPAVKVQVVSPPPHSSANERLETEDPASLDDDDPVSNKVIGRDIESEKRAFFMKKKGYGRYGNRYCCVKGCVNSSARNAHANKAKFFSIPKRYPEVRELWLKAINRVDKDGNPWQPREWSKICSLHFVGGKPSPTRQEFISHVWFTYPRVNQSLRGNISCNYLIKFWLMNWSQDESGILPDSHGVRSSNYE